MDKKKILVAEDVDGNFFLLDVILGEKYDLFRAKNGEEAVAMFSEVNPDIVLMDILMPKMDGLQATKEIRKIDTTTPIVAVTAYSYNKDNYIIDAVEENGFNGVILKPIRSDSLINEIEKHLNNLS